MVGASLAGYPGEVLLLWLAPAAIGQVAIGMVFGWLPHHPHNGHGRYTNTRATLFPLSGIIAMGHDRHVIHHMLPRVPHHRIPAVFDALRPMLEARGTRIEGSGAGPEADGLFLGSDPDRVAAIEQAAARADARLANGDAGTRLDHAT